MIKILLNAHGSSLVALALLAFAIKETHRKHTQKSFNHLNLDENLPLSLSLSHPPKLNAPKLDEPQLS
jgi:hypothetical protein